MKYELAYRKENGVYYPNLNFPAVEQKPFGKYGHMRLEYPKKHRRGTYTTLLTEGKLNEHLCQVDTEARKMVKRICAELAKKNGIDEELKSRDQMRWVQDMNNIKASAKEIVMNNIINR